MLWAGTIYKRSRRSVPTLTRKVTVWRFWKPFHLQLFQVRAFRTGQMPVRRCRVLLSGVTS